MKFATGDAIALAALCLSLITNILGALLWMRSADRKKFAAEREFGHVKTGLVTLTHNLDVLFQNLEHNQDMMKRDLFRILVFLEIESSKNSEKADN